MQATIPITSAVPAQPIDAASAPLLIDREQLAALLGISVRHVARLDDTGRIPQGLKLGRLKRWPRAEIEAWINAGCMSRDRWAAMQAASNRKRG